MIARFSVSVLVCLALVGCGGKSSPATTAAAPDSTPSTGQVLPAPAPAAGAETAARTVPVVPAQVVPAGESVPSIIGKAFPRARSVRTATDPFPHRVIRDSAGKTIGYEAFSDSAGVTARGYAGMVPVQVFFDRRGRPFRIFILDNCETPAYMDIILGAGLLDSLLGFDPARTDTVDAVTLATSSSHAIIAGVTALTARVAGEIAGNRGGQR